MSSGGLEVSLSIDCLIESLLAYTLTLYVLMGSFWFDTINLGWFIAYIKESQAINSKFLIKLYVSLFLSKQDEMSQYATFHLGLHCLTKYAFISQ